jgi:hypothetical protein
VVLREAVKRGNAVDPVYCHPSVVFTGLELDVSTVKYRCVLTHV